MSAPLPKASAARAAADALVAAGLVHASRADAAAAVIASHTPRTAGQYSFSADAEFLHSCLNHHVNSYFKQVLEPRAATHHNSTRAGRLINDKEVQESAVEITSLTMGELGGDYLTHMSRYFGDQAGAATYVFTRVHSAIQEAASQYNDNYLATLTRRSEIARRSVQLAAPAA